MSLKFIFSIKIFLLLNSEAAAAINWKLKLYEHLMSNYSRDLRPNLNATTVTLDPAIYSIVDIDEARESLVLSQWFEMSWVDDLLRWDPAQYGGITVLRVLQGRVFIPDVMIYQLTSQEIMGTREDSFITVDYRGRVFMTRSELITIHCQFDVSEFPYDKQNSTITYVAWAHPISEILLIPGTAPTARKDYFKESTEWGLLDYTVTTSRQDYGEVVGQWDEISYHIAVERKPFYYIITLTVPSFMLINLALVGVFSPSTARHDRQEKVSIGSTALLTMAVILMMVSDLMPKNSTSFPNLGKYIMWEMTIMAGGTLVAVALIYLNGLASFDYAVPEWLSRWLLGNHSYLVNEVPCSMSSTTTSIPAPAQKHMSTTTSLRLLQRRWSSTLNATNSLMGNGRVQHNQKHNLHVHGNYNNGNGSCTDIRKHKENSSNATSSYELYALLNNMHQTPVMNDLSTQTDVIEPVIQTYPSLPKDKQHSSAPNTNQFKLLATLRQVHEQVSMMGRVLQEHHNQRTQQQQLQLEWTRVCLRLDMIALVFFIILNSIVTAYFYLA